MKRPYHCVFVGLVTLLTFILIAFLLMFTDIGISPGDHLSNGNVWTARRLRLSAELAYYNYWLNPDQTGNSISPEREEVEVRVADSDELPRQHAGNHTERAQKVAEIVSGSADNRTALNTASPSQDLDEKKVQFSNIRKSSDSLPEVSMHSRRDNDITSDTNTTLTSVTQRNNSYDTAPDTTANAVNSSPTTGEPEWNSEEKVVIEETDEYYDSINDSNEEDQFEVIKNELQEVNTIQKTFLMEFEEKEEEDVLFSSLPLSQTVNDIDHKQTSPHNISPQLMERSTDPHFHMPCPKVYRPVGQIRTATWMKPLLHILSSFEGKQVTLVIANSAYRDVLLNWLISALIVSQPPLENIVVVCLDHVLYRLLQSKDIPSVVAPFSTVLNTKYRFRRYFELIMMMRLGFMRLINRLGYDSAMYDIDAIILKNPQSLYDKWSDADIIGSRGQLPRELWRRWGVTICIGAVFIRSNSNTGIICN